jgi:hypothetical protein
VLIAVDRQGHARRRVLGRQAQQVVLARHVVVQRGDRHAELVGDVAQRQTVEPAGVGGLGNHLAVDAGGTPDPAPVLVGRLPRGRHGPAP